jgi:FkbM family methyltransferase
MDIEFYGQQGEDYLLWQFFNFKTSGFFLDIGAFDGITISNTFSFERRGWTGACVEAHPERFKACAAVRKRTVHAACIATDARSIDLRIDRTGLFSGIAPNENEVSRLYANRGQGDPDFASVTVPAMRAADLLRPGDRPIDFASIDVEGAEIEVLRGLDLSKNQPRLLLIEATTDDERDRLTAFLAPHGYQLARSLQFNHFYVRGWLDAAKLRSITVDCRITIPESSFAAMATIETRAWAPPTTKTTIGYIASKARQRLRWLMLGV